jgi:hypothetical protein
MIGPIISRDTIRLQAIRAAEFDFNSGKPPTECRYDQDSIYEERWLAAYMARKTELRIISTFAGGAVEQLEEVSA